MGVEDKHADTHIVSEAVVEKRLDYDSESLAGAVPPEGTLKRQLKNRHIAMISIGGMYLSILTVRTGNVLKARAFAGVIGTGLFLGTASSLAAGGPIGLLLGYITVGTVCYSVMVRTSSRFSDVLGLTSSFSRYPSEK